MMKVGLGCDHAGFHLKEYVKKWHSDHGYDYIDYGTHSDASVDYPDYAHLLAEGIEKGECALGIGICGTGNGINMTLNKHKGIRSALCWKPEIAQLVREHNNANVLVMAGRFTTVDEASAMLDAFFSATFEGGRHQRRIDKMCCCG